MTYLLSLLFLIIIIKSCYAELNVIILYRDSVPLYSTIVDDISVKLTDIREINIIKINVDKNLQLSKILDLDKDKSYFFLTVGDLALKRLIEFSGDFSKFSHPGHFIFLSDHEILREVNRNQRWIGMTLNVPFKIKFDILLKTLDNIKSIGVLYSEQTEKMFEQLLDDCKGLSVRIRGTKIIDLRDIHKALIDLYEENDAVYILPDPNLSNKIIIKKAILMQFQYKKPFIGTGINGVILGATTSINYDPDSIVRIISNSIKKYLNQKKTFTPECCLKAIVVYYNPNTIQKLGIKFTTHENINYKNVQSYETF